MENVYEDNSDNLYDFLHDIREVLQEPALISQDELRRLLKICDSLIARLPVNDNAYIEMRSTVQEINQECPFKGLPVAHLALRSCHQVGHLQRAERRGFFDLSFNIRCTGKYFGGFLDGWLLLYSSPLGELRPHLTIRVMRAWDCADEDFKWPDRTLSQKEKYSWLLALMGRTSEEAPAVTDEDGIYVEPNEVNTLISREEINRSFNYDTPHTPPRRVMESENFKNKYADIKSRIAAQLLLHSPLSVTKSAIAPAPTQESSSSKWWFRKRKKTNSKNSSTELVNITKNQIKDDPTYDTIDNRNNPLV
uniref:Uncharacterized protein n=1 Tax=Lutzomyia longipalpis TaxID=7200 RepID=A0A1B0GL29_LUTLO